ncbi:hypothetical protein [Sediminispirochaeta smaragdinae]|uniref:Uncharacterized protein n=1 Tax=Sediminispirochaeta smaragdinae (strain DSM 11293 / JCM 15392 / SEBR 4228) TaxID=573413 RepID=E1R236_SEDSS|nr:hypothetical protein [Sediminispirochaeta smaragdinae]ADK81921.1 hypothetical protein Spirs_2818 [Sediminispirochaeta smaragdinae DSM 11293]
MKKFFKSFFNSTNDINESTVIGFVVAILFVAATFLNIVDAEKYQTIGWVLVGLFTGSTARNIVDTLKRSKGNP